nr:DUF4158 domain-containing protein [Streptomyces sp. Root1310]
MQICTIRYIGRFLGDDPLAVPWEIVEYLAPQLGIEDDSCVKRYPERRRTPYEHAQEIQERHVPRLHRPAVIAAALVLIGGGIWPGVTRLDSPDTKAPKTDAVPPYGEQVGLTRELTPGNCVSASWPAERFKDAPEPKIVDCEPTRTARFPTEVRGVRCSRRVFRPIRRPGAPSERGICGSHSSTGASAELAATLRCQWGCVCSRPVHMA